MRQHDWLVLGDAEDGQPGIGPGGIARQMVAEGDPQRVPSPSDCSIFSGISLRMKSILPTPASTSVSIDVMQERPPGNGQQRRRLTLGEGFHFGAMPGGEDHRSHTRLPPRLPRGCARAPRATRRPHCRRNTAATCAAAPDRSGRSTRRPPRASIAGRAECGRNRNRKGRPRPSRPSLRYRPGGGGSTSPGAALRRRPAEPRRRSDAIWRMTSGSSAAGKYPSR